MTDFADEYGRELRDDDATADALLEDDADDADLEDDADMPEEDA